MKKTAFGIVIKVKNLTACKAFYRDILDLGEPVLDSSFRVEVRFEETFSLFLEKAPWDVSQSPVSARCAWFFGSGDAELIRHKMKAYGYPASAVTSTAEADIPFCRFTDPDGNPFYVPVSLESNNLK